MRPEMIGHKDLPGKTVLRLIKSGEITLAGNRKQKIYGRLNCNSGKRMKKVNRVFFKETSDAIREGYRPCGCCLRPQYQEWKSARIGLRNSVERSRFEY